MAHELMKLFSHQFPPDNSNPRYLESVYVLLETSIIGIKLHCCEKLNLNQMFYKLLFRIGSCSSLYRGETLFYKKNGIIKLY